jgi:hypothetical protein
LRHGRLLAADDFGHLLRAQAFDLAQQEDHALLFGELGRELAEDLADLAVLELRQVAAEAVVLRALELQPHGLVVFSRLLRDRRWSIARLVVMR